MATNLELQAKEEATYIVVASFTDENGVAVVPSAITWSLYDDRGQVINNRENVSIATPAATVNIVLTGDDLAVGTDGTYRQIAVRWTYNSSLGSGLVGRGVANFRIEEVPGVS